MWQDYPCTLVKANIVGGYREVRFAGERKRAHVVAFYEHYGHWPINNCCHYCDKPNCVQPYHLFDGTQRDNIQDMLRKGRCSGRAVKWGVNTIKEIKRLRATGLFFFEIGKMLGIPRSSVIRLHRRVVQ